MKAIKNFRTLYPTLSQNNRRLIQSIFALATLSIMCFILVLVVNSTGFQLGDGHGYISRANIDSGMGIMWQIGYYGFALCGTLALALFIVTANKMNAEKESA